MGSVEIEVGLFSNSSTRLLAIWTKSHLQFTPFLGNVRGYRQIGVIPSWATGVNESYCLGVMAVS